MKTAWHHNKWMRQCDYCGFWNGMAKTKCWNCGGEIMTKTQGFCLNSRLWLVFMDANDSYPRTCPYDGDCDRCGYFEERKPSLYLKERRRDG